MDVLEACCHGNEATSCHLILSNKFSALVDVLVQALAAAEDGLASAARLCSLVTTLLVGGASEGWREGGVGSLQLQALSDCVRWGSGKATPLSCSHCDCGRGLQYSCMPSRISCSEKFSWLKNLPDFADHSQSAKILTTKILIQGSQAFARMNPPTLAKSGWGLGT